jgi:F420-dependent oxidoreductase-like protein
MLMRIGVFIGDATGLRTTIAELLDAARWAEAHGLATGWVPHIPWSLDGLTALALAGTVTERIELGTAVMPTYPRHPIVMAQQALSAQAAAGGRVTLGIGPSHPVVIEKMHGLAYDRPIRHIREYLEILRAAFAGTGYVSYSGELYHVETMLEVPGATAVDIFVAALGPQMLRAAGELADGTITYWADERAVGEHVVPRISEAAAGAGRPAPRIVVGLPIAIVDDVDLAHEQATRVFSTYTGIPAYQRILARGGAEHPADVAIIGNERAAAARLQSFESVGATDLCLAVVGLGPDRDATRKRTLQFLADLAGVR